MRPGRTILIAVVAIAVALLPTIGGMAAAASMQAASTSDCCHDHGACDDGAAVGDCASLAVCAVKCFNFVGMTDAGAPLSFAAKAVAIPAAPTAVSQAIPPPLRPPRV